MLSGADTYPIGKLGHCNRLLVWSEKPVFSQISVLSDKVSASSISTPR